jgi:hypothetical protein
MWMREKLLTRQVCSAPFIPLQTQREAYAERKTINFLTQTYAPTFFHDAFSVSFLASLTVIYSLRYYTRSRQSHIRVTR